MPEAQTQQQQQSTPEQNREPGVSPWLVALAVVLPAFMEVIDTSIATVAVPHIAGSLSASNDEATWVLTFYLLSNAIALPASAWLSLRFGRKRFLIASIVIFTVASFFCGAANSLIIILLARLVQGAGGGALQPLSQAILTESFPPEKRGMAMGMFGLGVVVAPILGPTLGGWLTDNLSWRWAFYINIPVGILAAFLIARYVKDPPYISQAKVGKLDKIGLGLLALGLGLMQIILDRGQQDDWFGATWIRLAFPLMVLALVAFIWSQLTRKDTLVDLRVFANRNFSTGCVLIFMFGAVIYGAVTILPLFFQTVMDYSSWWAGLAVAPRGIGSIIAMPLVGFLVSRLDTRILVSAGFASFGVCSLFWSFLTPQISPWSLTLPIIISGFSLGFVFVPLSTTTLGDLRPEEVGNGSGLYNLLRNLGGSIGISVVETILTRHQQLHQTELARNVYAGRPVVTEMLHGAANILRPGLGPYQARQLNLLQVAHEVLKQSAVWSYVDDFRYMALGCFCCVPIVWIFKKVKARGAMPAH